MVSQLSGSPHLWWEYLEHRNKESIKKFLHCTTALIRKDNLWALKTENRKQRSKPSAALSKISLPSKLCCKSSFSSCKNPQARGGNHSHSKVVSGPSLVVYVTVLVLFLHEWNMQMASYIGSFNEEEEGQETQLTKPAR